MVYILDAEGRVAAVVHPSKLTADVIRSVLAGKVPDVEQHPGWKDPAGAAKYFREQLEIQRRLAPFSRRSSRRIERWQ